MLNTTFAKAKENNACIDSYRKMAKELGGVRKYGLDTPIPLDKVMEVCGLEDTIWALRCTIEPSANLIIEFACLCVERVLHLYEDKYPDDKRPRQAIEAARLCIKDKSWAAARAAGAAWAARAAGAAWAAWAARAAEAAEDAARAAAWAAEAAWAAAWAAWAAEAAEDAARAAWAAEAAEDAARAAAGDAERKWQKDTLLELLGSPWHKD